ncbi:hypothetical protein OGAPHI_006874 [Ogataea philodendri]|uniref:ferric-chelate reductase (NADPH) n=1 Tax=Ogataea philodendri TaxID=1378263 RepID=A0A9P8SZ25_9ASCO|nr:uncharacterized protein OGAPHI_006874 [Ogataea philodendri]KAH3660288.1 hypothetical protein OGAPHI_006874 [Ogataea philodendri]
MTGRDLLVYDDVHCIADMKTDHYMMLKKASQAATPWADMALYGKYITYFIAGWIFFGSVKHFLFSNYDVDRRSDGPAKIWERLIAAGRFIVYRQLPTKICSQLGLPTSVGSLLLIGAVTLYSLLWCFVPHPYYRACLGFGSPPLGVRAGFISTAFVPFIFIMSGKSNIVGFLTGVSHEKLNKYHQTASILCLFFGWVHTIPFYYQANKEGGTSRVHEKMYSDAIWVSGVPPIIFLTLLWLGSLRIIRKFWYEAFVSFHWVLAVGFYISLFYHIYDELQAHKYLVATIIVWGLQFLYRWFAKGYLRPGRVMKKTVAKISQFESLNQKCVELMVDLPLNAVPGQHVFLRALDNTALQSHPFSVIPTSVGFKLLVRVYDGFTKHLFETASRSSTISLLVDGPYGGVSRDPRSFSNLFLICSGSGITTCLPFVSSYASLLDDPRASLSKIRLDWIVRHSDDVSWVRDELVAIYDTFKMETKTGALEINIYCVQSSEKEQVIGPEYNKFKPAVKELVRNFSLGSTNCIISSGSHALKNEVGNAAARLQSQVGKVREVYLHTEEFSF